MQPIKELSAAVWRCAGKGCALISQLANFHRLIFHILGGRGSVNCKQNMMAKHVANNLVVDSGAFIKRAALHVMM